MAGVKVTDLTSTSTAAATDVFYIVDTGSNTSKQIEVQDIYSGMPQFASGSFTPVISNETDCTVIALRGIYSRVDNVVTMSLYLSIGLDTAGSTGTFNIDLPVASTFANTRDLYGVASLMVNPISNLGQYIINGDTGNNKCYIEVTSDGIATGVSDFVATVQYLVL
jgi:hypothetical protein